MANRRLFQFQYSYERDLVDIYANVTIGAAGAPTLQSNAKGVSSITRNSAGDYSIALTDNFNKLMSLRAVSQNATGIIAAGSIGIKTDSVNSATAPLVRVVFSGPTAAGNTALIATDPAVGDIIRFHIVLRNAST